MPGTGHQEGILSPLLSRNSLVPAAIAAAVIIATTICIVPFGHTAEPAIPPLVLMYATMMSVIEGLTAYLFAVLFRARREPLLGALAGAFGFVAVMVFSQMLVFPGVITAKGLFSGGPQSSIWIWALWHSGFPIFVMIGLVLHRHAESTTNKRLLKQIGLALIPGGPLVAFFLVYLCIGQSWMLPRLITGTSYAALNHSPVMFVIIGGSILALIYCVGTTRLRDLLTLWLAIALLASLADATLTLSGAVRFDLGWYAGRSLSIIAASIVFCVLIYEISRLYDLMVETNKELAQRVMRDGLTGAFNRRYFSEQFPREVLRAKRELTELSLLLVDVDHFKNFNDVYGHQHGDECLIAVVAAMQEITKRPGDFVARYGGEEFAVLLPRTDIHGSRLIAEKIRCAVAALHLAAADETVSRVTVSIGLETLSPTLYLHSPKDLLRRADQALYSAKRQGRNLVRVFDPGDVTDMVPPPPARPTTIGQIYTNRV